MSTKIQKSEAKKRKSNSQMGEFKYEAYILKNIPKSLAIHEKNGNHLCKDAIIKEVNQIMNMKIFWPISKSEKDKLGEG